MKPRLVLLAALVAAIGLGPATSSASAVPREFFGVVSLSQPTPTEFRTMGRGGVGTFRMVLSWSSIHPTPGAGRWAPYDAMVEHAALNGIRVMPTLYASPRWVTPSETTPPTGPAQGAWARFVNEAVSRYGSGGSFWRKFAIDHPGARSMPVIHWQVWNEVSSPSYWWPRPSAKKYGKFVKLTARVIRARNPGAQIVLSGLFTKPMRKGAIRLEPFMKRLYKVKKIKKFFDAVAIHPYARKPKDAIKAVRLMRTILKRNKDKRTPMWVTETGWASSGPPTRFTVSPARQAGYLNRVYRKLRKRSRRWKVAGVIWYSLRDSAGSDWVYRSGLFDAAGRAKPAWWTYVSLAGGR